MLQKLEAGAGGVRVVAIYGCSILDAALKKRV